MPRDKLNSKKVLPLWTERAPGVELHSKLILCCSVLITHTRTTTPIAYTFRALLPHFASNRSTPASNSPSQPFPIQHDLIHLSASGFCCLSGLVESHSSKKSTFPNDIIGLQLAGYLENLELSLYTGGCEGFTDVEWIAAGFPPTFQQDICAIAEVILPDLSFTQLLT
jgi:hypothetical protein